MKNKLPWPVHRETEKEYDERMTSGKSMFISFNKLTQPVYRVPESELLAFRTLCEMAKNHSDYNPECAALIELATKLWREIFDNQDK